MIIKLTGTKSGETVQLVKTRKPEGALLKGEYQYQKDAESPITAYRKKLSNEITDFQLNRVNVRKGEYEGNPTRTYSLRITYSGKSHIVDLGGGMTAQSIVNSFVSLKDMEETARHASDLSISFYNNKEGYASASVRKEGELLQWFLSNEQKNEYIQTAPDPFKKDVVVKNFDLLDAKFEELIGELNATLPQGASSGSNALDDEDSEDASTQSTSSNEIPFADTPSDAEVEV